MVLYICNQERLQNTLFGGIQMNTKKSDNAIRRATAKNDGAVGNFADIYCKRDGSKNNDRSNSGITDCFIKVGNAYKPAEVKVNEGNKFTLDGLRKNKYIVLGMYDTAILGNLDGLTVEEIAEKITLKITTVETLINSGCIGSKGEFKRILYKSKKYKNFFESLADFERQKTYTAEEIK